MIKEKKPVVQVTSQIIGEVTFKHYECPSFFPRNDGAEQEIRYFTLHKVNYKWKMDPSEVGLADVSISAMSKWFETILSHCRDSECKVTLKDGIASMNQLTK